MVPIFPAALVQQGKATMVAQASSRTANDSVKAVVVAVVVVLAQRLRLPMQVDPVDPVLLTPSAQALRKHTRVVVAAAP
jgi:hypothetical protein